MTQARTLRERAARLSRWLSSPPLSRQSAHASWYSWCAWVSISTGLVIWGVVDAVMLTSQIKVLDKRAADMMRTRDAAAKIAAEAQEL